MKKIRLVERKSGATLLEKVRWCSSFGSRFLGFQFRRKLKAGEALVLVHARDSSKGSSIHMFFVFTPLAVTWINKEGRVTHTALAQPWKPYYASPEPACYVLETETEFMGRLDPGDQVEFIFE